jgi:hypothetical protein
MLDARQIYVVDRGLYYYRENLESVSNVYNRQMFAKLILLGTELERQFDERKSNLHRQLYGYLARHSLECIRNELLFRVDASYRVKQISIKNFVNNPLLTKALSFTIPKIKDRKTKVKMLLARYKLIGILYLLYLGRAAVMGKCKCEN